MCAARTSWRFIATLPPMLALSPHSSFSAMGWPQQDEGIPPGGGVGFFYDEERSACYTLKEAEISNQSLGFYSPQRELEVDALHDHRIGQHYYSGRLAGCSKDSSGSTKKLCHNAYERDRRKKLNDLYTSLRALLPESDQSKKKKLSIPLTVSRVLKYIPELQGQVKRMSKRKEEILSALPRREGPANSSCVESKMYPSVSATCLSEREVMVQLCLPNQYAMISYSEVLKVLERAGLMLLNASTYATDDGRCFCSLHLQAKEAPKTEMICEELKREIRGAIKM